jgi:hypothetical protein
MAEADGSRDRHRFLSVCGYSCMVPGIGTINAKRCYPDVTIEEIAGTGDVLISDRQQSLQKRAWEVAQEFNMLVAASYRAAGKSACLPFENWDEALTDLTKLVWSLSPGTFTEGTVGIHPSRSTFEVSLPKGRSFGDMHQAACESLRKNGLGGKAALAYRTAGPGEALFQQVACSS